MKIFEKEKELNTSYTDERAKFVAEDVGKAVKEAITCIVWKYNNVAQMLPRHKVVVQTIIGEKAGQGLKVTSKSIWNPDTDNSTTYIFENVARVFTCCRTKSSALCWYLDTTLNNLTFSLHYFIYYSPNWK